MNDQQLLSLSDVARVVDVDPAVYSARVRADFAPRPVSGWAATGRWRAADVHAYVGLASARPRQRLWPRGVRRPAALTRLVGEANPAGWSLRVAAAARALTGRGLAG